MNEGVAEASERMLKGAGAFAHETPYAVGKHYRQINSSPDVYLVRVPFLNISTSETNCYLICDGGECLAVDTGAPTPEGAALLDAAIDELGIDKARMSFFLTHLHMDHAGLIDHVAPKEALIALSLTDFNLMAASSDVEYLRITEAQVSAEGFDCDLVHSQLQARGAQLEIRCRRRRYCSGANEARGRRYRGPHARPPRAFPPWVGLVVFRRPHPVRHLARFGPALGGRRYHGRVSCELAKGV